MCDMPANLSRFVPKPRPDVFRITKTNHNILQGAVPPDVRATDEQLSKISDWITENAERYWLQENGPLRPRTKGGADVIIVDDPQMPQLISIAKEQDEQRPILFRSHIEVRDDLVQVSRSLLRPTSTDMLTATGRRKCCRPCLEVYVAERPESRHVHQSSSSHLRS